MIKRLINTIKYLKPIQLLYRVKNKFQIKRYKKYFNVKYEKISCYVPTLHGDQYYLKRFAFDKKQDNIIILNQNIKLDYSQIQNYSPLVQFNIQYFEYAIVWAQRGIEFQYLKKKWNDYLTANIPLQPYVISLQIPNMLIAMDIYGAFDQEIMDELYSRYRWLLKHQEKHLLANHYFENLKAIVIASCVFNDNTIYKKYIRKLIKECKKEILTDGVHFELSPMYHKIIFEDLLLLRKICNISDFDDYIQSMLDAIYSLEHGFNRTPLFNDSGDNVSKSLNSLIATCKNFLNITPRLKKELHQSGYYILEKEKISLLIDAGRIGPNYNPGHSHCDCLSFEACVDGIPVLVNSGTFQYQGKKRAYFRSTSAHNTLTIAGHEQSELWGEHRVGRRIKNNHAFLEGDTFIGSFFNQFKEKHKRKIVLREGKLSVIDTLEKVKNGEKIKSSLHLAPGYNLIDGFIVGPTTKYELELIRSSVQTTESLYSVDFGKIENNQCLVFEWLSDEKEHGYIINFTQ